MKKAQAETINATSFVSSDKFAVRTASSTNFGNVSSSAKSRLAFLAFYRSRVFVDFRAFVFVFVIRLSRRATGGSYVVSRGSSMNLRKARIVELATREGFGLRVTRGY